MAIEDGEWIMRGLDWDDPSRTQSWEELIGLIDEVGFLPLFKNEVDSFSAEENTSDLYWWTGDEEQDPWEWGWSTASSSTARRALSPGRGFPTSPTGGETATTLTAAGTRSWPPCGRSGSWTSS